MKGLVFTEFMEMVEGKFGEDMVDDLIDATDPDSGGSYTSVGTYNHQELVNMVVELSSKTEIPVPDLIKVFGHHLAGVFSSKFSGFFEEVTSTIDFLKRIDNHIHVEVAKLYPDAELPEFSFDDSQQGVFYLNYASTRGLADLAHGLIEAVSQHYQESFDIERHDSVDGDLQKTQFILRQA